MNVIEEQAKAKAMLLAIVMEGVATIDGRDYTFLKMTHKKRRKVFAFYSTVAVKVQNKDMSFLDSPEFEAVEQVVNESVSYNDALLSILGDSHWDKYPGDYVTFVMIALQVISYPFFPEDPTG